MFHLTGELFNRTAGVEHHPRALSRRLAADAGHRRRPYPVAAHLAVERAGRAGSGKAKVLAILEPQRYAKMPNVPSITEIVPAFRKPSTWFGFFGPAKLPPEISRGSTPRCASAITAPDGARRSSEAAT